MGQLSPELVRLYLAAQAVIYNRNIYPRLKQMMATRPGAIMAVQTVLQAVNAKKPIPPQDGPTLSVLVYLVICAMIAKDIGKQPDAQVVKSVSAELEKGAAMQGIGQQQAAPAQPQQPAPQRGLVGNAMAGA